MSSTSGGGVPAVHGAPPAPIGRRVTASLVDGVLTALVAAPLWAATVPAAVASVRQEEPAATPSGALLVTGAVLLAVWGVVQWVCHGTRGWTVGRRLLGLRTVDVRSARPLGMGRALVRSLVVAIGALACGVGQLLVLLSPLFDGTGRRRGWHDRVADAVVVDVRGLPAARRVAAWEPVRRPATEPVVAREVPWAGPGTTDDPPGDATPVRPGVDDPPGAVRAPQPDLPARTRWAALAGERQLDAPGLVLPPLGRPGPGPDLDTRQMPTVPAAGALPGWPGTAGDVERAGRHAAPGAAAAPGPAHAVPSVPTPPHPDAPAAPEEARTPLPAAPVWAVPPAPVAPAPAPTPGPVAAPAPESAPAPQPRLAPEPWLPPAPEARVAPAPEPRLALPPEPRVPPAPEPRLALPPEPPLPPVPPLPPEPFPATATAPGPDVPRSWAVRLPDGTVVGLEAPLLVGRNPEPQPGVRVAPVSDPGRSVSKTHLMLGADEHGAWVVDRGSTNGTLVTLADGQRIVCLPDRRVRLTDGSLVAFGDLSLSVGLRA